MLRTTTRGFALGRNPNDAASGDSPSSTRIVPLSIRSDHCSAEPAVPAGAITTASPEPFTNPIDESAASQVVAWSPSTRYENPPACAADANMKIAKLFRKDIPDPGAHVIEIGPIRIRGVDQVRPAQR